MPDQPPSSSASRVTLLVALLAATVLVASLLPDEAHDASRAERVTVDRALRDYASVAAWELETASRKRLETTLGRGLGAVTAGTATSPYETLLPVSALRASAAGSLPCGDG